MENVALRDSRGRLYFHDSGLCSKCVVKDRLDTALPMHGSPRVLFCRKDVADKKVDGLGPGGRFALFELLFMDRTVDQRIQYLKNIEQGWEDGVQWTDHIIEELRDGFDAEKEKKPWTAEWEQRWRKFVNSKVHRDRVVWSKFEWRFFLETCQGRSLVTGQPIAQCGVVSSMMAATRLQTAF
ncbi:hypothetical protein BC939DRAFT_494449 [Gamsiella multidivaricata]|uniref:uncharacterized protein n=1 Tax=Gamsiella multidivaricata TaxID=101098 RepID=UPI00221EFEE3|nr:uncharacterized protein BC939DRAFT_494449 [Gamsiella multidivaricata]KAI7820866.1 hypothetical protein BC939DRAFT_494449 [Gamsiella multidivaricata]